MITYIFRRVLMVIPVLWGIATIVFIIVFAIPGDPVRLILGQHGDEKTRKMIEEKWGLDKPKIVQYGRFLGNLVRGKFGRSYRKREDVWKVLMRDKFFFTFLLAFAAVIIAVVLGMILGSIAAYFQGSWLDGIVMSSAVIGISTPVFWLGLMLILLFAIHLKWLPLPGGDLNVKYLFGLKFLPVPNLKYLILPALTLSAIMVGYIARMTRSSLLEVIRQDYIRTARAKGLSKRIAVFKHGLRNALIPVITIIGLNFAGLLGGAVATETVFAWPGVGREMVIAIENRDVPVIEGGVVILAFLFVVANIIVDISYAYLDPRIRLK